LRRFMHEELDLQWLGWNDVHHTILPSLFGGFQMNPVMETYPSSAIASTSD